MKICNLNFSSYILNASGPKCTSLEELEKIGESDSAAIMFKSCTIKPRHGNPKPRYIDLPFGSIQSMGLPNLGYLEYIKIADKLKKYNKPKIASIAGFNINEYRTMVKAFQKSSVDMIEINLSCPNIASKIPTAYDNDLLEKTLEHILGCGDKPIGIKLPAYYDINQFQKIAELILKYKISFITCINSIGHSLFINPETERPVIKPNDGFGGLGGRYIKPMALANVRTYRKLLGNRITIFGVGGIEKGSDAFEYLLAGADAVQVGTEFMRNGVNCFEVINRELKNLLIKKKYLSIQFAKGKLKMFSI